MSKVRLYLLSFLIVVLLFICILSLFFTASQFSERLSQLVGIKDELEKAANITRYVIYC